MFICRTRFRSSERLNWVILAWVTLARIPLTLVAANDDRLNQVVYAAGQFRAERNTIVLPSNHPDTRERLVVTANDRRQAGVRINFDALNLNNGD